MTTTFSAAPRRKRDVRRFALGLLVGGVFGLYFLLSVLMNGEGREVSEAGGSRLARPAAAGQGFEDLHVSPLRALPEVENEPPSVEGTSNSPGPAVRDLLRKADAEIASGKHDMALRTLNQIRPLDPENPLAYLKIGEALLAKKDYATARDFFAAAIDRNPVLGRAYFGYAVASEGLGDLESALGGMRSYLHVEKDKSPGRLPVAQARSAIWEWESKLGRGPWGPTKGIPPGFTADEIKRDGRGTAVRMQKPETLRPDGTMDWEIKAGDRFPELWKP